MLEKTDLEKCKQFVIETAKEEFKEIKKLSNNSTFHQTIIGNFIDPFAKDYFDNVITTIEERVDSLQVLIAMLQYQAIPYVLQNIQQYINEEDLKEILNTYEISRK